MKSLVVVLLIVAAVCANAQDKSTYRWYFGWNQGLDFTTLPPTVLSDGQCGHVEGCSVVSDAESGALLFYTNGDTVWNRNHEVMAKRINALGYSSSQAALIVRQPGSKTVFHLFTTTSQGQGAGRHFIVDMRANGGLGAVVFADSSFTKRVVAEKLAAVAAANGRDYWILFRSIGNGTSGFLAYALSGNGVSSVPVESVVGNNIDPSGVNSNSIGCMCVSPDGKKIASAQHTDDVTLFDFDAASGRVSRPQVLNLNDFKQCYGVEFSASGRYLYANYMRIPPNDTLVRFDVWASDVQGSKQAVGWCPTGLFGQLLRGRDNRIYVANYREPYLSVISDADSAVPTWTLKAVNLAGPCLLGLPNFPPAVADPWPTNSTTLLTSDYACLGSTISYRIHSALGDSLAALLIFEDGSSRTVSGNDSTISFTRTLPKQQNYFVKAIVWSARDSASSPRDTVTAQTNVYYNCCNDVVRNGGFQSVAAGNQCFTVEYTTDMDFRESTSSSCPYVVSAPGQLACNSRPYFGNPAWDAALRNSTRDYMLYGEPLPNLAQRAWIERVPVWRNRRYVCRAFVCNVEKLPRFDTTNCSLHFALTIRQNGKTDTIAALHNVKYSDGWMELSGTYTPLSDDDIEIAVVVLHRGPTKLSFGFAIDDISCAPIPYLQLDAGADTLVCRGAAVRLPATASGALTVRWTPSVGLQSDTVLQPLASPQNTTMYRLVAYDTTGCELSDSILVRVIDPVSLLLLAPKRNLCSGDSLSISVHDGFHSVVWSDGTTGPSLNVKKAGSYFARAVDQFGCDVFSDTVSVVEQSNIAVRAWVVDSLEVYAGQRFRLPIVVEQIPDVLHGCRFSAYLRFHKQVLRSADPSTVGTTSGDWTTLRIDGVLSTSDTIAYATLQALLDTNRASEVLLDSLVLSSPCRIDYATQPGHVQVRACWIGGTIAITEAASTILSVYPNPATESVVLSLSSAFNPGASIELYNALGEALHPELVGMSSTPTTFIELKLSALAAGMYRVVLRNSDAVSTALICKQ